MSDGLKNWPYQKTFDAIAAATKIEGGNIAVSVVRFAESFGDYPGESEEQRKSFAENNVALSQGEGVPVSTSVALARDAQIGLPALERVVSEVDHALTVLHHIRLVTIAPLDDRIDDDRVDVQLPVHLLGLHGHVAIQPQQIKPNNAPHAHPRFRRGHYRARVTSQLKVAA